MTHPRFYKRPEINARDFCLANHARAAAWAREDRTKGRSDRARWAAGVAREWWQRFLLA